MNAETLISRLSTCSDAEAAAPVAADTRRNLAERIMATPFDEHHKPVRSRTRRRILAGVPIAAGLSAAAIAVMSLSGPGTKVGPVHVGPAQALAFSAPEGGYITVQIKDPFADPARYQKEFAAHGMRIDLLLEPVSPSIVGTLIADGAANIPKDKLVYRADGTIDKDKSRGEPRPDKRQPMPLFTKGTCQAAGGGACPIGMRIPVGYRNHDMIVFGRAARPGERYTATGSVTSPGEVMHGLAFRGHTVTEVLAMLQKRGVTVAAYRANGPAHPDGSLTVESPKTVPGTWYVRAADPYADHQVMLWVGAEPRP